MGEPSGESNEQLNALGLPIELCCQDPVTGFFRDGSCNTCAQDTGSHTVCAVMTAEFLAFSKFGVRDMVSSSFAPADPKVDMFVILFVNYSTKHFLL
mgnify:CR=1 FL=1